MYTQYAGLQRAELGAQGGDAGGALVVVRRLLPLRRRQQLLRLGRVRRQLRGKDAHHSHHAIRFATSYS